MDRHIESTARQPIPNRSGASHKTARFRRMECDHAVRRAVRSREMAKALLAEAQQDNVISHERAGELRDQLDQE